MITSTLLQVLEQKSYNKRKRTLCGASVSLIGESPSILKTLLGFAFAQPTLPTFPSVVYCYGVHTSATSVHFRTLTKFSTVMLNVATAK